MMISTKYFQGKAKKQDNMDIQRVGFSAEAIAR